MSNLQHRQDLIKAKRMKTEWRDFVLEIASWYNFALYKNKGLMSRYPQVDRNTNIVADLHISMNCELEGDLGLGFIPGFNDLYSRSSKSRILNFGVNENCEFTDACFGAKNCYLSFGVGRGIENTLYSFFVISNCTNIINSMSVHYNCSNVFSSKGVKDCYNIFYSTNVTLSNNIWFSSNLIGCSECIFCDDLQNQSYCIRNKQYSKEEYFLEKILLLREKKEFQSRYAGIIGNLGNISSTQCSGKGIIRSEYIVQGLIVTDSSVGRNVILLEGGEKGSKNMFDGIDIGVDSNDLYANCQVGTNSDNLYCCVFVGMSSNCYYCMNLDTCSFCLGCIGLKNKSYCILNKQYTKEERYEKVDEIFGQMEKDGTLGNFFPASMNPFYFNDTAAYLIGSSLGSAEQPFTKEEVVARGYLRRDEPIKVDIPEGAKVVKTSELGKFELSSPPTPSPSERGASLTLSEGEGGFRIAEAGGGYSIDPEILNYIIQDEQGNVYRIMKMEYDFLMKYGLPLPRKHRLDRMKENFRTH